MNGTIKNPDVLALRWMHLRGFSKAARHYNPFAPDRTDIYKIVYHGVNAANRFGADMSDKNTDDRFDFISAVKLYIYKLTPNELMRIFPVSKTYDGKRWESKDYYSVMEVLNKHGLDTPLGEAVDHILWEYLNPVIHVFLSGLLCVVGDLHKRETGRDILLDFFESQGTHLTICTKVTDQRDGSEYMVNNDTGERSLIRKPRPKYLKFKRRLK